MSVSSPHAAENPASQPIPRPFHTLAGGRPRSLDDDAKQLVCQLLVKGMTFKQAAAYVACDPDTIRNERKRDPHFDFNVKRARAMADLAPLAVVRAAAKTSWRAAAWLIDYRRRSKKEAAEARRQADAAEQLLPAPQAADQQAAPAETPTARPKARRARRSPSTRRRTSRESFSASPRAAHASVLEAMLAILEQRSSGQGLTLDRPPLAESPELRPEPKNLAPEANGDDSIDE